MQPTIADQYCQGETLNALSEIYGMDVRRIKRILRDAGVSLRPKNSLRPKGRYSLDFSYFKIIDSHEKAYWLGFLYADGCVHGYTTKLKLKEREPIDAFKKATQSGHKVTFTQSLDKRTGKTYSQYGIAICSQEFTSHLRAMGLGEDTYKNYAFPNIHEELWGSFVRGVFDGDGCISFIRGQVPKTRVQIILSEKMAITLQTYLHEKMALSKRKTKRTTDNPLFKIVTVDIGSPAIRFLDWIYQHSTLETRLDRKYQKYLQYKTYLDNPEGIRFIKHRRCRS